LGNERVNVVVGGEIVAVWAEEHLPLGMIRASEGMAIFFRVTAVIFLLESGVIIS
jgi:hypothetical protein